MCQFISVTTHKNSKAQLEKILLVNNFAAHLVDNPTVRLLDDPDSVQFHTCLGHCDCGTILGRWDDSDPFEREIKKLKTKGWSDSKIERHISYKTKSHQLSRIKDDQDLLRWENLIRVALGSGIERVGLIVHMYSGNQNTEEFSGDQKKIKYGTHIRSALQELKKDELCIFYRDKVKI